MTEVRKYGRTKTIFNTKTIHIDGHVHSLIEEAKVQLKTKTFSETIEKVFGIWKNPPTPEILTFLGTVITTMPEECQREFILANRKIAHRSEQSPE